MKSPRSGFSLVLLGLGGVAFFLATDPRWGFVHWGTADNSIDAANQARIGTLVGVAGSGVVLFIGLWLMTRRTV